MAPQGEEGKMGMLFSLDGKHCHSRCCISPVSPAFTHVM